jgi:hypothetical protein
LRMKRTTRLQETLSGTTGSTSPRDPSAPSRTL